MALMDKAEALWEAQAYAREVYVQQEMQKAAEKLVKDSKSKLTRMIEDMGERKIAFEVKPREEELAFVPSDVSVTASVNSRTSVTYDPESTEKAVEERLGRTVARKIVKRTYTVTDWDALVSWAKSLGASPSEFLKFFSVDRAVDQKELDRAYEFGMLTVDDLDGCYSMKQSEPYLVFRARKA